MSSGERAPTLAQIMIQPKLVGFTAKENSWAEFVLIKVECAKNAWVIQRFKDLELLKGSSAH